MSAARDWFASRSDVSLREACTGVEPHRCAVARPHVPTRGAPEPLQAHIYAEKKSGCRWKRRATFSLHLSTFTVVDALHHGRARILRQVSPEMKRKALEQLVGAPAKSPLKVRC